MMSSTVKGKTDSEFGVQNPIGLIERLPLWQLDVVSLPDTTSKPEAERKSTGCSLLDGVCSTYIR